MSHDSLLYCDRQQPVCCQTTGQRMIQYSLSEKQVTLFNVTFEPGRRNNWHIYHAAKSLYQEEGKEPKRILPGTVTSIPTGVYTGMAPGKTAVSPSDS